MQARHIARETATLRRLREKRKSSVRGYYGESRLMEELEGILVD
jgi:hypothetical protein